MIITSLEIKQQEFERSFRGYNVEEVNSFLGNIASEWDRMLNENKMLKMQVDIAEKDAAKLREVEMTLIRTLRSAEESSAKLTATAEAEAKDKVESARLEAEGILFNAQKEAQKLVNDAKLQERTLLSDAEKASSKLLSEAESTSNKLVAEAENTAKQLVAEAENNGKQLVAEAEGKAEAIQKASEYEIAELDAQYNNLEKKKNEVLAIIKGNINQLNQLIENSGATDLEPVTLPVVEIKSEPKEKVVDFFKETEEVKVDEEEDLDSGISIPSAVNEITLDTSSEDKSNLEIIEGIGPKIKEVLNDAGIVNFRTLATTPEYRLRDILAAAGPHFAAHDPATWNEQALLAESEQWDKLEELKHQLRGGRVVNDEVLETTVVDGSNTDDMLDKVNKVKAAIRKAMAEKSEPNSDLKPTGSSFFDSL